MSGPDELTPVPNGSVPSEDKPLTEVQIRLMSFVDDEMGNSDRAAFETEMANNPELAIEAARLKELADLTGALATAEPTEVEMRQFWGSFYNRAEWQMGWVLLLVGLAVLFLEGIYLVVVADFPWWVKAAIFSTLAGGAMLLWNTVRLKLRTSRFDRYRGVMR